MGNKFNLILFWISLKFVSLRNPQEMFGVQLCQCPDCYTIKEVMKVVIKLWTIDTVFSSTDEIDGIYGRGRKCQWISNFLFGELFWDGVLSSFQHNQHRPLHGSVRSTHLLIQATTWLEYVSSITPPVYSLYIGTHHQEHCISLTSIESRNSKNVKYFKDGLEFKKLHTDA